jgi:hypothetical protein
LGQLLFGVFNGKKLQKTFRADAGPSCEHALKVKFTHVHRLGQGGQAGLLQVVRLQVGDRFFDALIVQSPLSLRLRLVNGAAL